MTPSPSTGRAKANWSVAMVTTSVTSTARCGGRGAVSRCASRNALSSIAEMAQEAQRRLPGHFRRRALPMLPALDEHRAARVRRIVEGAVVAQALSGRMAGVDDDVLRNADRLGKLEPLALATGQRKRRTGVGHRMQVEQVVGGVVDRTQLAGPPQVRRLPVAFEHLGGPQPIEILVDAA